MTLFSAVSKAPPEIRQLTLVVPVVHPTPNPRICSRRSIAVSIETKRGAVHQDTAYVQLGIWTAAHFTKLRQLTQDRSPTLPVLPVVFVQGHEWKMMLASMKPDPRLEMLGYLSLGDTGTLTGVYCVIAAIRKLAKWIDEQYRPWFEEEVLGDQVSKQPEK